jgi:hypothetical protein
MKNDNLKMAALWDITLCSLRVDDGGNKHLLNVGQLLGDYTAQYSRSLYLQTRRRENLKS